MSSLLKFFIFLIISIQVFSDFPTSEQQKKYCESSVCEKNSVQSIMLDVAHSMKILSHEKN